MVTLVPDRGDNTKVCSEISKIDVITNEIERLYRLQDRWLAEALLKLSREIKVNHRQYLSNKSSSEKTRTLLDKVVPEIARRLGAVKFEKHENFELSHLSDLELRKFSGICLVHSDIASLSFIDLKPEVQAEEIIGNAIENGNPIVFALDRICKTKAASRKDWLSKHMFNVDRNKTKKASTVYLTDFDLDQEQKQG